MRKLRCFLTVAPLLLGCGGGARAIVGAKIPLAPPGVYVSDDVGAGYVAYRDVLARWGEWSADSMWGVHWCPRPGAAFPDNAPFHPYRSRGHWQADESRPAYGTPPGSPFWTSDDAETWGDITMHHGWWVQTPDAFGQITALGEWCWVPGVEETPARVVWRSGGGFVGWAPEPPSWLDDGDEGVYASFDWTFVLEGALLEGDVGDQCLEGDAEDSARSATARRVIVYEPNVPRFARIGPQAKDVRDARTALLAFVHAHPELGGQGAHAPVAGHDTRSVGTPASSSGSSPANKKKTSETDELPRAGSIVPILMREPIAGPLGLTPHIFKIADAFGSNATSTSTSASVASGGGSSTHSTAHATTSTATHTSSVTSVSSGSSHGASTSTHGHK
jgi:hypothetical protein